MDLQQLLLSQFDQSRRARLLFQGERVLRVNGSLAALLGVGAESLVGRPLEELLAPLPLSGGQRVIRLRTPDGCKACSCRVQLDEEEDAGLLLLDSAGGLGNEAMAERLASILEITQKMASSLEPGEILQEIAEACRRLVDARTTTVFALSADGRRLKPLYTDDPEFHDEMMGFELPVGTGLTGHVVQTGQPQIVNDPDTSPLVVQVPNTPDEVDEVLMSLPLRTADRVLGALTLTRPLEQPFDAADLEIISILGGQAAALLESAELHDRITESELKNRSLVENADIGLFRLGLDGHLLELNPFILQVLGLSRVEDVGDRQFWGSERSRERFLAQLEAEGRVRDFACRTMHADGRLVDLLISARRFAELGYSEGVLRDITVQRRLETENRNRLAFLDNLIAQLPLALLILNADRTPRHCNPAFERLFATSRRELLVESDEDGLVGRLIRGLPPLRELWAGCLRGEAGVEEDLRVPAELLPGVEHERHVSVTAVPVQNQIGNLTDVVLLFEDVGGRRQLQNQLIRAQKMESVGSLAGGLAHDFNNLLGGILGSAGFLRQLVPGQEDAHRQLDVIEGAVGKAARLTRQLLGFARQGTESLERVAVNSAVEQALELFQRSIDPRIRIEPRLGGALPAIEADALQVEQAVLNLLLNAADALPGEGRIGITTRLRQVDEREARATPVLKAGRFVEIEVQDDGCGIPDELQTRVFDPFFSTKDSDKGSGLGLSMVYNIVRSHGGHIELASRTGYGTRVRLLFPALQEAPAPASSAVAPASGERVVVVDDDAVLRDMLRRILESLGYAVQTFESGAAVIDWFSRHADEADLVILDVLMPDMSGLEVHEELALRRPDIRVLFCSGYTRGQDDEILSLPGVKGFLEKPFTLGSLSAMVRRALES
jgi:PAS domain S-box-containing protein